jgi:hypothetical protein
MQPFEVIVNAQTGEETLRPYSPQKVAEIEKVLYDRGVKEVRSQRNALLSSCDWTQLPDAPVDQTACAAYRQALRDITDQEGFPSSVVWPVPPT